MHLQAWDPYYFSPFGVETKLRSYSMVGVRISSPYCSLLFSFFCFKYSFRFFFVNSCLFRSYSFHSHRVRNRAWPNPCGFFFFCCFFLLLFIYFARNFVSQFNFVALFVESRNSEILIMFTQSDFNNGNTILQFDNMANL